MDWWKVTLTWHYHGGCKLVALDLHCSYSYITVIDLHMYTISCIVNYIHSNSCDLSNNIHTHKNMLSCNELQMVIPTLKPNCEASCKSPHLLIAIIEYATQTLVSWNSFALVHYVGHIVWHLTQHNWVKVWPFHSIYNKAF
jgi:hypothetical protein